MKNVFQFIESNRERFIQELCDFVRIPSVSADPAHQPDIRRAAEWCATKLRAIGFERVAVEATRKNPVVTGEWLHAGKEKPIILWYGHYDVQPEVPVEKWTSPPFKPVIRNGAIYGRGADDNKGQLITHLMAFEAFFATHKKLPVNVKVFIEGEEEVGGEGSEEFVRKNASRLACNAVAISDTAWARDDMPSICHALRGLCYLDVRVKGPCRDLHSGAYGGRVRNPLNAMAAMIATLQDDNGRILIPGYYDDVVPLTAAEKRDFAAAGESDEALKKALNVSALWGEEGYTATERNWARPSMDVNGIWGGYAGKGAKTVIAAEGGFKISSRLVANQHPERCAGMILQFLRQHASPGVTIEAEIIQGAKPMMVPVDHPYLQAACAAFERSYGRRALLVRDGATIPITATFLEALNAPSILAGHGRHGDAAHSPDEHFSLECLFGGAKTNVALYEEFANISQP